MNHIIGILGGMGPAATVDTMSKMIKNTVASKDQEHVPIIALSVPDIPDRSACILNQQESPLIKLREYVKIIENAGAECLIIPCNTAHYWFEELKTSTHIEMISIIDTTIARIAESQVSKVGLLATSATIATRLYQDRLAEAGIECLLPSPEQQSEVMKGIYQYKAGNLTLARELITRVNKSLLARDIGKVIMGCTEIPLILYFEAKNQPDIYIDTTEELVKAAIFWYQKKVLQDNELIAQLAAVN